MTCIVGIAQGGNVWMGADSFALSCDLVYSQPSKLARRGELIFGTSGEWRYNELIALAMELEQPKPDDDICRYVAVDFARALRAAAREFGFIEQANGQDQMPGRVLIGARGRLFNLDGGLSHLCITEGYAAIGSGAQVAMGSLYESQSRALKPQERLQRALEAAAALTDGVRPPFIFDSLIGLEA